VIFVVPDTWPRGPQKGRGAGNKQRQSYLRVTPRNVENVGPVAADSCEVHVAEMHAPPPHLASLGSLSWSILHFYNKDTRFLRAGKIC